MQIASSSHLRLNTEIFRPFPQWMDDIYIPRSQTKISYYELGFEFVTEAAIPPSIYLYSAVLWKQ